MTLDWFTATETSDSNGNYNEHDNGLNVTLLPGEVGTFNNTTNTTAESRQILTKTGASNNFAFNSQLTTTSSQTTTSISIVSFPKLHKGGVTNSLGNVESGVTISETGRDINGQESLNNSSAYQLVMNYTAQDGFSYAPRTQSTGHTRMTIGVTVHCCASSAGPGSPLR